MKNRLHIALLLAAVVLVYGNTLWNEFTLDDAFYITQNAQVTQPSVRELLAPHAVSAVFRPVTFGTFALNWALQARPFWFHVVNLLLHAAVTLLLYFLLQAILVALPRGKMVAFVAALLFAVHPIHTEAVTSISGRPELLAAGFLLAACILHLSDREIPALACFVLAVLSKESAVVFLPFVLVCDYARGQWKSMFRYARLATVTLLYLAVVWRAKGGRFGQVDNSMDVLDNPLAALPTPWRILNALRVAWKYLALQVYPRMLSCDYSLNQIHIYQDWRHTLPAAMVAAAALAALAWAVRTNRRELVLAGGIYLVGFATTANILVSIGTIMGERLAYLPSAGFCLLVALGWVWLLGQGEGSDRQRTLAFGLLAAVLAAFAGRAVVRNLDWKDDHTLYASGLAASPGSAKMHDFMGHMYLANGQFDLARGELQTALGIYPDYLDALETYGLVEFGLGHYQTAGGMLEKALYRTGRYNRNYDFMAVNLAAFYMQTDHLDGALDILNQEIAQSPQYARAWSNRAVIRYKRGEAAAARADAETALRLDAGNSQAQTVMRLLSAPAPSSAASPK